MLKVRVSIPQECLEAVVGIVSRSAAPRVGVCVRDGRGGRETRAGGIRRGPRGVQRRLGGPQASLQRLEPSVERSERGGETAVELGEGRHDRRKVGGRWWWSIDTGEHRKRCLELLKASREELCQLRCLGLRSRHLLLKMLLSQSLLLKLLLLKVPLTRRRMSEMESPGPRNSGSGDIGYGFVDLRGPRRNIGGPRLE